MEKEEMNSTIEILTPEDQANRKEKMKRKYLMLIALSSGIDLIMTTIDLGLAIPTFGGSIILEEVLEYFISSKLASMSEGIELSKRDKIIGALPIPGVTALSVHCLRELRKL